jgi:hypothetical protein
VITSEELIRELGKDAAYQPLFLICVERQPKEYIWVRGYMLKRFYMQTTRWHSHNLRMNSKKKGLFKLNGILKNLISYFPVREPR